MSTEKRFTYDDGVWDNNVEDMADALLSEKECCDLLNALHEENIELQSRIGVTFDVNDRLHKENVKLHEENQRIKQTIQEAYNNERTQIGKNTLKQLLEALE